MKRMVKLYDVIDIRTDQHYSVVVVDERKARFFIPANTEEVTPA